MKTKEELIATMKTENPILKCGSDETGYTELSPEEYETTINEWADNFIVRQNKTTEAEQAAAAKAALLAKLGITADEFKTLLGGN